MLSAAVLGVAVLAGRTSAEIHDGGVNVTDWNGTYHLVGASSNNPSLLPNDKDPLEIRMNAPNATDIEVTIGGERTTIRARTNASENRHYMTIKGRQVKIYSSWVDGYGKNRTITLTPDPLRPGVPYSVREFLLTSSHAVILEALVRDPRNQVPLATFGGDPGGRRRGGTKVKDVVDARAVYMMPVSQTASDR